MFGVEASGERVRRHHERKRVVCKKEHRNKEFFGVVHLLGPTASFGASLDCPRQLGEVEHTKTRFRMVFAIVGERAGDSLRSDQTEVVKIIGPRGMGKISVEDASAEFGAIAGDAVKVVLVGARIEFRDERAVLIDGSVENENVDTTRKCGSN